MIFFGERIREMASRLKIEEQQIAKDLGLTKSQLSLYLNGHRKIPSELLQKIVDKYKINPLFLFRENASLYDVKSDETSSYTYFPTSISAGIPLDVEAVTEQEKIELPNALMGKYANNQNIFFLKANGDSMDRIIPDGSLMGVLPIELETLKNGDIVVFSNGGEYGVKYFFKDGDKLIFKPNSTNIEHHEKHFDSFQNIKIHGKVVIYNVILE